MNYQNIIDEWSKSNKILFISSGKRGLGKKFLANQISKNYEIINCDPGDIKNINNIGIQSMFKQYKKKLLIYYYENINLNDIKLFDFIKIIVIINTTNIYIKVKNIIKKHIHINIKPDIQLLSNILETKLNLNSNLCKSLLLNYDYNLNTIINNYKSNKIKVTDYFYDNSLTFINLKFNNNLNLYRLNINYSLTSLHMLDNDNINIDDKLDIYRNVILSDIININDTNLNNYKKFLSFIYPYYISKIKNNITNYSYNKYISKSLIYINLLNGDKLDFDLIVDKIKSEKNLDEIYPDKISKKRIKYIKKLYNLIR